MEKSTLTKKSTEVKNKMTSTREFDEEEIRSVNIRNYHKEDRDLKDNIEVSIHFKEDADVEVSNNVLIFKADVMNAEELRQLVAGEK